MSFINHFIQNTYKKNMKEYGPAFVGIELKQKEDYLPLIERLKLKGIEYENLKDNPNLFTYFL